MLFRDGEASLGVPGPQCPLAGRGFQRTANDQVGPSSQRAAFVKAHPAWASSRFISRWARRPKYVVPIRKIRTLTRTT
jgi:hypothetical protein